MPNYSALPPASYLRSRVGRICVAIFGDTIEELLERAEAALAESQFLEFRLDRLGRRDQPARAIAPIAKFLAAHKEVVAIATCRRKEFGGSFDGTLMDELNVLAAATEAGFAIVDLEIESAEQCNAFELQTLHEADSALLISFHDFEKHIDLEAAFARIQRFQPDFVKVVSTAHSVLDSLELVNWMKMRSGDSQLVGIAMGEPGVLSRILSLRSGSAFTFASASDGSGTAPGQIAVRTLKDLYRVEELDQATRIYGVAGNPISHSMSPWMQNSAFRRERINAVFVPLKTDSAEELMQLARQLPLSGISVTMPLKQKVLPFLANVDPMSAKLGACNTIRAGADGKLYGFNTDVAGVVRPLEKRMALRGASALILGAGGAARAAAYGLADKGARVSIWSRKEASARELANGCGGVAIGLPQIAATEFDILINATPCGMTGNPHPLPLEPETWNARLVFDLVYNPLQTPLLEEAHARGIATIQGVEMFVHQGARQFELWTGKPAPEAEMLRVVQFALNRPHGSVVERS